MPDRARVYVEVGEKKAFASSIDWPGWSRGGRDEAAALQELLDHAERYRRTIGTASRGMPRPRAVADLEVVERLQGSGSTDFGIPDKPASVDADDLDDTELRRQVRVLKASWDAFARIAADATGASLRKGPRGGGRDVDKIVEHVFDAEAAYLPRLGGRYEPLAGADRFEAAEGRRAAALEAIEIRSRGGEPPKPPRTNLWSLAYYIRRVAWHALDHAWEIQNRRD